MIIFFYQNWSDTSNSMQYLQFSISMLQNVNMTLVCGVTVILTQTKEREFVHWSPGMRIASWKNLSQKLVQNLMEKVLFKLPHDKTNKVTCAPSKDSDQPGLSHSLISLRCPHGETLGPKLPIECIAKTDQTGQVPRLIWVFAGCIAILLFLSCRGSYFGRSHSLSYLWWRTL